MNKLIDIIRERYNLHKETNSYNIVVENVAVLFIKTFSLYSRIYEYYQRELSYTLKFDNHRYWSKDGELHRDGYPAVIKADGEEFWYKHGKRHRNDGPAWIGLDGWNVWYHEDEIHRSDGPAMYNNNPLSVYNGTELWYVNGQEITDEVMEWINDNDIQLPLSDNDLLYFRMRWV